MTANLYVHFPFCRRKCSYCALYSRVGVSQADRDAYVRGLADELGSLFSGSPSLSTIYFGGGSPALCDLSVLAPALHSLCDERTEFTVELHPSDVTPEKLAQLKTLGVNRISMGVQSFCDGVLADMGRGYAADEAVRAFELVKEQFDNAGIDLIVGYPGDWNGAKMPRWRDGLERFHRMGMRHCSVYSLQNERGFTDVPDDDTVLDGIRQISTWLGEMGLERYEISNYAAQGYACRHNLAVWRGEDYVGLGEGAYGRIGLKRTVGRKASVTTTSVSPEEDRKERTLFRLRTREGLDTSFYPEWRETLGRFVREGLLTRSDDIYRLTDRGTEVCDSILAELV